MVISDTGEKLGILSRNEALDMAYERNMDLYVVAPDAKPPVAKFIDYNKHKYESQRKQRESRKNQKVTTLKEIRLSPTIDVHDFDTKVRSAHKFLEKGDKVKVSIRFRGREMAYTSQGKEVMEKFAEKLSDVATVEGKPTIDGRSMFMRLAPTKEKK